MAVNNELKKPETDDDFEAMCHQLYKRIWSDVSCVRVGGTGQEQFGIDIIGYDGKRSVGVQCKHYNKKLFTLKTVTDDVITADAAALKIAHLLFATTAASKSSLVKDIQEFSEQRRSAGKFTVSVDFWNDISGHIRVHPDIGRAFIPDFPGGALVSILENSTATLILVEEDSASRERFQATAIELLRSVQDAVTKQASSPDARGDEADPRVVTALDFIRDRVREGKSTDAKALLENLGDPFLFQDQYSRFRWLTNRAAVDLQEGLIEAAAQGFLTAFPFAPLDEKALANRAHAHLLLRDGAAASSACDEGLLQFPESAYLWSLKLHARFLIGDDTVEQDIPSGLRNSPELLFSLARLRSKQRDYKTATELLRQCLEADGGSLEGKGAYLADVLSWASTEPVLVHHGHMAQEMRAALEDAVMRLEPLEQNLQAIQADQTSLELTNNVAVALTFLGQTERARALAALFLVRHPRADGLLRIRLNQLDEQEDFTAIRSMTDSRLSELSTPILITLAEVSANCGDLHWHSTVMQAIEDSGAEIERMHDLRILAIHARWISEPNQETLDLTQTYVQAHPDHVLARVMLGQMLSRLGQKEQAIAETLSCLPYLYDRGPVPDVLHVANLLFHLRQFHDASLLFSKLVPEPGNDELTWKLLVCLVESDQRHKALSILDQLTPEVRQLPQMRRIEVNLARHMGHWERMRDILADELRRAPNSGDLAVGYAGALYRLGDKAALKAYLQSDPEFNDKAVESDIEFAKYQRTGGFPELAIARLYRLYRGHPNDSKVAGYFLSQILMTSGLEQLKAPNSVRPGASVQIRSSAETWWVAIDTQPNTPPNSWPELVSPASEIAQELNGKTIGGKVRILRGTLEQEVEIVGLGNVLAFAAGKANEQISAAAIPAGPLWSVRVIKDDGDLDIDIFLRTSKERRERVERAFEAYRQQPIPISTLAKMMGSDVITLLLEWPSDFANFFVGFGTRKEREAAFLLIRERSHPYVLDLVTLAELVRHGVFHASAQVLGRPLIPQTMRERLLVLLQLARHPQESVSMGERDGELQLHEIPQAHYSHREQFLLDMLRCIDTDCDVVPTTGPEFITETHRSLATILDSDALDSLYLCLERKAVLLSEDGALRMFASEAAVSMSMGLQPVLMEALRAGQLTSEKYAKTISRKVEAGHNFVSIRFEDLVVLSRLTPDRAVPSVVSGIETLRNPAVEFSSAMQVASRFVSEIAKHLPATIVATYALLVVDALQETKPQEATSIHGHFANLLQGIFGRGGRKLSVRDRRLFGNLLERSARTAP